jgi:UDP-2,4-diacetamido-2,4,6-trideoxy-beta-L-altropyranose hydrolase
MYKIAIFCKTGFSTGMGHAYRQVRLGKVLRSRGMDIEFFVTDHPPSIELLREEKFSPKIIANKDDLPGEMKNFSDLVLLDIQDTGKDFILALRDRSRKIMSFEDLGEGRNFVDLLVDCNLEPEQAQYLKPPVKALFGLPYSVLAEEFGQFHQREKIFSESLRSILVTMGGTDPNNLTLKLAEYFLQSKKKTAITFIAGPGFKETSSLIELVSSMKSFQVLNQPNNMAELLFNHQAVFCSGGVTLHEALAVGTPAFVTSQVIAQQKKTRPLEKLGAAIDLGLAKDFDPNKISRIWELTKNQLESRSLKGKELLDGKGIVRVADEIIELLSN